MVLRECGEAAVAGQVTTDVSPHLSVVGEVVLLRVQVRDSWVCFGDVPVELMFNHSLGDVVAELFDVLEEECIAQPSSDHHDGINWHFPEVQSHHHP
eukprot:scaffold248476_cov125-Cyclotella_meneghiniana.AAC.1